MTLEARPLRLNAHPLPAMVLPPAVAPGERVELMQEWLSGQCGDYARARVTFVAAYFRFISDVLQGDGAAIAEPVARFGGLFAAGDWVWSALRPLPRAWMATPDGPVGADFMFWDGAALTAIVLAPAGEAALVQAGVRVVHVRPGVALAGVLPPGFSAFWRDEALPSSPFRRAVPPP